MKTFIYILLITILFLFSSNRSSAVFQTSGWEYNSDLKNDVNSEQPLPKEILKKVKKTVEGMKFIPGGTFIMGKSDHSALFSDRDSTLLVTNFPRKVTLSSFYICDHEVTNAEYRKFVFWVRDSIAAILLANYGFEGYTDENSGILIRENKIDWDSQDEDYREALKPLYLSDRERFYRRKGIDSKKLIYKYKTNNSEIKSISVYPDTLAWISGGPAYSFSEPLTRTYFRNPEYDDYPVTGISWEQANAYCIWLTKQLRHTLSDFNSDPGAYPEFTLPSEAQWEYAASGNTDLKTETTNPKYDQNIFPWGKNTLTDKKGNYLANFGPIIDKNGYHVKEFTEETNKTIYMYTAPVKSYQPNIFKLYDMGGNVSEWTVDYAVPFILSGFDPADTLTVSADDNFENAFKKVLTQYMKTNQFNPDTSEIIVKERLVYMTEMSMHDAKVLERNKNGRIVKGGSWVTGPKYLQCSSREVYSQNKSSSFTGFRVALILQENN